MVAILGLYGIANLALFLFIAIGVSVSNDA